MDRDTNQLSTTPNIWFLSFRFSITHNSWSVNRSDKKNDFQINHGNRNIMIGKEQHRDPARYWNRPSTRRVRLSRSFLTKGAHTHTNTCLISQCTIDPTKISVPSSKYTVFYTIPFIISLSYFSIYLSFG